MNELIILIDIYIYCGDTLKNACFCNGNESSFISNLTKTAIKEYSCVGDVLINGQTADNLRHQVSRRGDLHKVLLLLCVQGAPGPVDEKALSKLNTTVSDI